MRVTRAILPALGVLGMVVALAPSTARAQQGGPPAAPVRFDKVRSERLERQRTVTGGLRAVNRSRVAAEHQGLVMKLEVDVGDRVESGQPIAQLDDTLLQLDLDRLRAQHESADAKVQENEARVDKAQRDVERLEAAVGRGGVSETELEDARLDLKAAEALAGEAKADLASSEAQIKYAQEEIEKMSVRAPISGYVVAKSVEVGEWVDEGGEVVQIVDLSKVDAWLDVPERFVAPVASAGATVKVVIDALDRTVESSDVVVVAEGDNLARTFPVRVRLDNPEGAMRPGMSVMGLVPTGIPANVLTVSKDAILRDDAGTYVYSDMGGKAIPIRLRKLWAVGDRVVVEADGLKPGMRVVVEGNERLYPSQPIRDAGASPAAPAGSGVEAGVGEGS